MSLPEDFQLRRATAEDIDTLVAHRRAMFVDMGYRDETALNRMATHCRAWLLDKMQRDEYLAWLVTTADGSVAAGTGLWLMDWPPHMISAGRRGNILNVYTAAEFRRRGLARELVKTAVEWCRSHAIDVVVLHASEEGRSLYESEGFAASNEMRMKL